MSRKISRRQFLKSSLIGSGLVGISCPTFLPCSLAVGGYQANERLNIALVGVAGRGSWFVDAIPQIGENIVALCDVNERRAAPAFARFPNVPRFRDFRRMFDQMAKAIDAVVVSVPDHNHAVISFTAMSLKKHVYCEKPLTHDVWEARILRQAAEKYGVMTQMGNQGTATHAFRRGVELIQTGALGEVREVYVWKDSGGSGERPVPVGQQPMPDYLDWDVWLGPAAERPFHEQWLQWHAWRDFATGNLGNWASHSANMAFMGLRIDSLWKADSPGGRIKVVAEVESQATRAFPRWEIVRWQVPARDDLPPVTIEWFNGAGAPGRRQLVENLMGKKLDWGDAGRQKWDDHAGCLIRGSQQMIHATGHNSTFVLLPSGRSSDEEGVPQILPRAGSHEREWTAACKGGQRKPFSHFGYSGPLTEFLMLGNVATLLPQQELEFDPQKGEITNHPEANAALRREYRKGWSLG